MCDWDAGGHEETEEYHLPRIPATHPHLKTLPMCWCDGAGEVKPSWYKNILLYTFNIYVICE